MDARLSQDERSAVARRIFAALCAHYPDRYIALSERPRLGSSSPEPDPATARSSSLLAGTDDSTGGKADVSSARSP